MEGPIASRERLVQLGLDPAAYPSCAAPHQENVPNKGRVWVTMGCSQHYDCPWKNSTQLQLPADDAHAWDTVPRPRNVVTKFIKPNPTGPGDRVINNYCACWQFLAGMKRRDGKNNEIAEVVGGEGDTVRLRRSRRIQHPDGTVTFQPIAEPTVVPRFADPTEVPELFEDVEAGQDRIENKQRTVDAERARRLGVEIPGRTDKREEVTVLKGIRPDAG